MIRRCALIVLGLYWSGCGALMALNPPPPGFRRAAALPLLGWLVIGVAVYLAVKAVVGRDPSPLRSRRPPRHAGSDSESLRESLLLAGGAALGTIAGVWALWWGLANGSLAMVGLGMAALPLVVVAVPWVVALIRRLT